jgi:hypothetical protein
LAASLFVQALFFAHLLPFWVQISIISFVISQTSVFLFKLVSGGHRFTSFIKKPAGVEPAAAGAGCRFR